MTKATLTKVDDHGPFTRWSGARGGVYWALPKGSCDFVKALWGKPTTSIARHIFTVLCLDHSGISLEAFERAVQGEPVPISEDAIAELWQALNEFRVRFFRPHYQGQWPSDFKPPMRDWAGQVEFEMAGDTPYYDPAVGQARKDD